MWQLLCTVALGALMALASHQEPENEEVARLNERVQTLENTNAIRQNTVAHAFAHIAELENRIGNLQNYIRELEDTIRSNVTADPPIGPDTMYRAQIYSRRGPQVQ